MRIGQEEEKRERKEIYCLDRMPGLYLLHSFLIGQDRVYFLLSLFIVLSI
jgi:hypothetical protein